jgi:hypothetical protein
MIEEKAEPGACVAEEVRGSLPASIPGRSRARIGREVFVRASGEGVSEVIERSMGFARSPNKSPEPTPRLGVVRSLFWRAKLRGNPRGVAHL